MPILSSCGIKWNKAQKNLLLKGRHPLNVSLLEIAWDKIITNTLQLRAFSPVRSIQFHSVQLLSHVRLFAIPWTSACQASLSITISWSFSNSCSLSWWCHPTFSFSVDLFSSCLQSSQHQGLFKWVSSLHQFSSVTQLCPTLCDPMDCSMPDFPVHHQLLELTQTHIHQVSDAIQLSHPLLTPCPLTFNLSQHQGLF